MKVHLMFRDRDFDVKQELPPNAPDLMQDLELEVILQSMAKNNEYLYGVAKHAILCSLYDEESILYRQEILQDCIKYPNVVREIYQIPVESETLKHKRWMGFFTHSPGGVLYSSVELMSMFVELLERLRGIATSYSGSFASEGFTTFFSTILKELNTEYIETIKYHLKQLHFKNGVLLSAKLGKGSEGTDYLLRLPNSKNKNWIKQTFSKKSPVYSFSISERDDAGGRFLEDVKNQGINLAANALAQAADHIDSVFKALQQEMAFYIGCLNLYELLQTLNYPVSYPIPNSKESFTSKNKNLYDVCLALTSKQKVVGNNLDAASNQLTIITGANQGGKSTFLRSIGLAQLMMQSGLFVPAESFSANLCTGIFTHYKRKEDASMKSGKLDEELKRMSKLIDWIRPNALVLFNESFASTNEREGSEIAIQITDALIEKDVKVYYVTHMFELAHRCYEKHSKNSLFLRAERKSEGKRTFRLIEGEPLSTSYGKDVFNNVFGKNE